MPAALPGSIRIYGDKLFKFYKKKKREKHLRELLPRKPVAASGRWKTVVQGSIWRKNSFNTEVADLY